MNLLDNDSKEIEEDAVEQIAEEFEDATTATKALRSETGTKSKAWREWWSKKCC